MTEISELERRIARALDRIDQGVEALPPGGSDPVPEGGATAAEGTDSSEEVAQLRAALDAERNSNAQLNERVRAIRERQENTVDQLERKLARVTEQLDAQGLELQRLKKTNARLVETNASLRTAAEGELPDADLLNRSMMAELEALRAERRAETVEMEEILGALKPLIVESADA